MDEQNQDLFHSNEKDLDLVSFIYIIIMFGTVIKFYFISNIFPLSNFLKLVCKKMIIFSFCFVYTHVCYLINLKNHNIIDRQTLERPIQEISLLGLGL